MSKRASLEDWQKHRPGIVAAGKYRNQKTVVDGVELDSKKEAARWIELQQLQRNGEITKLRRQVNYGLTVSGELICSYLADFSYRDKNNQLVVEDVKSEVTRKLPVYRIKCKLMAACHGIEIREV